MNRKSVYIMVIAGLILAPFGCENDTHDNDKQPAHLLYSEPSNNATIVIGSVLTIDILLVFDRAPRTVTILGKKAYIVGNTAEWKAWLTHDYRYHKTGTVPDDYLDPKTGKLTLPITWVNPDGSSGEGTVISLYVVKNDGYGPEYVSGTFDAGHENLDPDVLNRDGIVMEFDAPIVSSTLVLALEESIRESRPLNWTRTVEDKTIRFERLNGEPLHFNKTYIIYGTLTGPVNYYKTDMLNRFTTKESAVEREDEEE